jgi:hypothetical protein
VTIELDSEPLPTDDVPDDFAKALSHDKQASAAWETLRPSRKREYVKLITSPKQAETRARRLRKAIDELSSGTAAPVRAPVKVPNAELIGARARDELDGDLAREGARGRSAFKVPAPGWLFAGCRRPREGSPLYPICGLRCGSQDTEAGRSRSRLSTDRRVLPVHNLSGALARPPRTALSTCANREASKTRAASTSPGQVMLGHRAHDVLSAWSGFVGGEMAVRCAPAFRRLVSLVEYADVSARRRGCRVRGRGRFSRARHLKAQRPRPAPRSS